MLISEKISKMVNIILRENEEHLFVDFLIQEFGREVTKSELAQAIIGWAELYMQGSNSGDFEGVAKYLSLDVYSKISDELSAMFKNNISSYLEFTEEIEDGEEAQ